MTHDEFIARATATHGDRYDYSKTVFAGISKKLTITCKTHGDFQTIARNHIKGCHCLKCAGKAKLTTREFIENARAVHGDRYDYSKVDYQGNSKKVEIICPEHGSFFPKPLNHIANQSGCPACAGCQRTTRDDFIARARLAHGDKYDYSQADYRGVDTPVTIICPTHGAFLQSPYDHTRGHGCRECGIEKSATANRRPFGEFVRLANERFANRLDYSRATYINSATPLEIICPNHGAFWQSPAAHLVSTGCPACSPVARVSQDEFISRATAAHGDRYDYRKTILARMDEKVIVTCPQHGDFRTLPKDHIAKQSGCPACAREATTSTGENELAAWVQAQGFAIARNDRTELDGFEIDIFIPEKRIGIEFHGAYWHSDNTLQHPRIHETKLTRAEKAGIRLIAVWDFDWLNRRPFIQAALSHHLGITNSTRIDARKCTIATVDNKTASTFYDQHHIQGAAWRQLANYALMMGDRMVACMSFSQGASRRGKTGSAEWELIRYATDGIVRGGASRLFTAFVREHVPAAIWSFSDRQHFSGNLYNVLGFENDGRIAADYRVYHQSSGTIWHKSAWQRRNIPARLKEINSPIQFDPASDPRTEREIQALANCIRIMDAGKIRWKWTPPGAGQ